MTFADATKILKDCRYKLFNSIVATGGAIKGFAIPNMASELSKNMIQNELASKAIQAYGRKGLTWMMVALQVCITHSLNLQSQYTIK